MFCPAPWSCCMQGSCTVPCFCSGYLRSGSWVLAFLCLVAFNLPQLCMHVVTFLAPCSFLVFCCSRIQEDICPGASTAAKDPRFQPVSLTNLPFLDPGADGINTSIVWSFINPTLTICRLYFQQKMSNKETKEAVERMH